MIVILAASLGSLLGCKSPAEKLVAQYLAEGRCVDRAKHVLNTKAVEPYFEAAYDPKDCPVSPKKIEAGADCKDLVVGGYCTVRAELERGSITFCVTRTSAGFALDWLCTTGFNPVTLAELSVKHGKGRVRVKVTLDPSGAGAKEGQLAFLLDERRGSGHGYVYDDSKEGKRLFALLKSGKKKDLILRVEHREDDEFFITELLQEDWHHGPADD